MMFYPNIYLVVSNIFFNSPFHIIMGCHPSHWLSLHDFSRWLFILHHQTSMIIYGFTGFKHRFTIDFLMVTKKRCTFPFPPRSSWPPWGSTSGTTSSTHVLGACHDRFTVSMSPNSVMCMRIDTYKYMLYNYGNDISNMCGGRGRPNRPRR